MVRASTLHSGAGLTAYFLTDRLDLLLPGAIFSYG